jgi:hypothetical protein
MSFTNPHVLWLGLAALILWWALGYRAFSFGHPKLDIHPLKQPVSWLAYGGRLSLCSLWLCLVACLAGPVSVKVFRESKPGALVLIQQDASDSQQQGVTNRRELELAGQDEAAQAGAQTNDPGKTGLYIMDRQRSMERNRTARRIDVSFAAIRLFLEHTYGNPVGMMVFDSGAYSNYPPTTSYQALLDGLPDIEEYMLMDVQGGHGTNFDGPSGTKLDTGALQSICNVFGNADPEVVKIHIMSTDGGAEISEPRFKELAACYLRLKINLIVFGVGEDWYDPASSAIQPLKEFVRAVGGMAVAVGDKQAFEAALERVDALSRASIYMSDRSEYEDNYMPWLGAAGMCLAVWLILSIATRDEL